MNKDQSRTVLGREGRQLDKGRGKVLHYGVAEVE